MGNDVLQETEIFGIILPIVKHFYKITHPKEIFKYKPLQQKDILKLYGYRFQYKINRNNIYNGLELIKKAERPIFSIGVGTITSNAYKGLLNLTKLFSIPVTTALTEKGSCNEKEFLSFGILRMHMFMIILLSANMIY